MRLQSDESPATHLWTTVTLGEIFDIGSSKRVLQKQWKREGVPFYRAREIVKLAHFGAVENDLFISEEHFSELAESHGIPRPGDLMVSAVGTLGACYVVQPSDRFYFKDASVLQFRPTADIEPRFFEYLFRSAAFLREVQKSDGATVGTLTITRAKALSLTLPPLEAQKRIVAVLDQAFAALDRARANAEAKGTELRELRQSILQNHLSPTQHSQNTLSWDVVPLSRVSQTFADGDWVESKDQSPDGIRLVQTGNVGEGRFKDRRDKARFISTETFDRLNCTEVLPGDVLVSRLPDPVGRSCVIPETGDKMITAVDLSLIHI